MAAPITTFATEEEAIELTKGAGIVRAVGDGVRSIAVGDKVLMSYAACGQCPSCNAGETAYCWHHMEMNFSGYRYRDGQWTTPSALDWPAGAREPEPVHGAFFQQSAFDDLGRARRRRHRRGARGRGGGDLPPRGLGSAGARRGRRPFPRR